MATSTGNLYGTRQPITKLALIEKITKAKELKVIGNDYYKDNNYRKAIHQYHSGLMYLKGVECDLKPITDYFLPAVEAKPPPLSEEESEEVYILTVEMHNNLAACFLKQDPIRYDRVLEWSSKAVEDQPNNIKALYRMAMAYYHLQDYLTAKEAVKKAEELTKGKDAAVFKLNLLIESKLKEEEKECSTIYKGSLLKNLFN